MGSFAPTIASQLNIKVSQVQAVLDLFGESATIPFIARYRKDKTGGLDEFQIQKIEEASKFLKTFTERKVQVKITEIDIARKRIALSIKQTSDAPAKTASSRPAIQKPALNEDLSSLSVNDALQALKKRFGK